MPGALSGRKEPLLLKKIYLIKGKKKLTRFDKLLNYIQYLIKRRFTGTIQIIFNQGGIQGVKKIHNEKVDLNNE